MLFSFSTDHVNFTNGLMKPTGTFPAGLKKGSRIRMDINNFTGIMHVCGTPFNKIAKLVSLHFTRLETRSAYPNPCFR